VAQLDNKQAAPHARRSAAPHQGSPNLERVYWPENKALQQPPPHQARPAALPRAGFAYMLPHLADRPLTHDPHARRHSRPALLPEALGAGAGPEFVEAVTVFSGHKDESTSTCCATTCRRSSGSRNRHTRVPHLALPRDRRGPEAATKSTDYASSLESLEGSILN
jgi:bifunctional non-homologous end joining protein LigD